MLATLGKLGAGMLLEQQRSAASWKCQSLCQRPEAKAEEPGVPWRAQARAGQGPGETGSMEGESLALEERLAGCAEAWAPSAGRRA